MEKVLTPSSGEERELVKKKKTHWEKAGMSREQWLTAVKFDSTDWGWVIMSIGMAIGAGIVFLPVQVGLAGIWIYLLSSIIGYPAMYLFQRLFINTLAKSERCEDYPQCHWQLLRQKLGALFRSAVLLDAYHLGLRLFYGYQ